MIRTKCVKSKIKFVEYIPRDGMKGNTEFKADGGQELQC